MEELKKSKEIIAEKLLSNHLFDAVNKPQWISELMKEGFSEEEARLGFKDAAQKYHYSRAEIKNKKLHKKFTTSDIVKSTAKYTAGGILTFMVAPMIYIIVCLLGIAVLGYIFGF